MLKARSKCVPVGKKYEMFVGGGIGLFQCVTVNAMNH